MNDIDEPVPTEHHHCPISTCHWYYATPTRMTRVELQQALDTGDLAGVEAGRDRLLLIETAVRAHMEKHTLLEWVTEVHQQRVRADNAEAQLAAIGPTHEEWGVRGTWNADGETRTGYAICETEEHARIALEQYRAVDRNERNPVERVLVQRLAGAWHEVELEPEDA